MHTACWPPRQSAPGAWRRDLTSALWGQQQEQQDLLPTADPLPLLPPPPRPLRGFGAEGQPGKLSTSDPWARDAHRSLLTALKFREGRRWVGGDGEAARLKCKSVRGPEERSGGDAVRTSVNRQGIPAGASVLNTLPALPGRRQSPDWELAGCCCCFRLLPGPCPYVFLPMCGGSFFRR